MQFKEFLENKEAVEQKIAENQEVKECSASDYKNFLREQLDMIKSTPIESLREQNNRLIREFKEKESGLIEKETGLTEDEKVKIREAHPDWPDEIINAIGSWEEYQIYDKAGLQYAEINGKPCLIRSDIDMNQKDEFGRTNRERMEQGLAPLGKDGKPIELHHIGQKPDSPLAELTQEEHRGRGNYTILHDKAKPTEIDRGEFQKEKEGHWETRAGQS
jgi:hypothetical protein